tara:strand:+ start:2160 stop:2822 length:663 start_codon:yes stop_codon:yes gene_type:complete
MSKSSEIEKHFLDAFATTNKEFIYIPIPKTGTRSILKLMNKIYGKDLKFSHHSYKWVANTISQAELARAKVFATVRNPWARMYSIFSYYGPQSKFPLKSKNFRDFIMTSPIEYANWYQDEGCWEDFYNQSRWLADVSGEIKVDKIFKLENLNNRDLNGFFGVSGHKIYHVNRSTSKKQHYSLFYDDDMIEVVYKLCKEDIDNFNYNFEYKENTEKRDKNG